jgi:CTP synthase
VSAKDAATIYEIPMNFAEENLDGIILKLLQLPGGQRRMEDWEALLDRIRKPKDEVNIALVGKYAGLHDSYLSLSRP